MPKINKKAQTSFELIMILGAALIIALFVIASLSGVFKANKSDALAKASNYKKYSCSSPEVYKYQNVFLALHFDENSTLINDSSRFKLTYNSSLGFNTGLGVKGGGLILNSSGLSSNFTNSIYNSTAFTLTFWFNVTGVGNSATLFTTDLFGIQVTGTPAVVFNFSSYTSSPYEFSLNTWNNVAVVRFDNGTTFLYFNGDLVEKLTNTVTNTNQMVFGASGNQISATIDEFKYYNFAMSASQLEDDLFCGIRNNQ